MSWDSYIDTLIKYSESAGENHVDKVAICGLDGSTWTSSAHACALKILPAEVTAIASVLKTRDFSPMYSNGVVIENTKYQFLRNEDNRVMAKKVALGSITIEASTTAFIIAHCPEGKQQGICNKAVGNIAEYLKSQNM